jgi:hypothetical protein
MEECARGRRPGGRDDDPEEEAMKKEIDAPNMDKWINYTDLTGRHGRLLHCVASDARLDAYLTAFSGCSTFPILKPWVSRSVPTVYRWPSPSRPNTSDFIVPQSQILATIADESLTMQE